jgi:hypothetical protein
MGTHEKKKKNGFCIMSTQSSMTELPTFKASSEQLLHHCRWLQPEVSTGNAHLSFGFNLAQFW